MGLTAESSFAGSGSGSGSGSGLRAPGSGLGILRRRGLSAQLRSDAHAISAAVFGMVQSLISALVDKFPAVVALVFKCDPD